MNTTKELFDNFIEKIKTIFSALILIFIIPVLFLLPILLTKFTSAEILAQKHLEKEYPVLKNIHITEQILTKHIYENSKYTMDGAVCNDGWISSSTGSGTCSHHNGVDYWYEEGEYWRTIYEAKDIAIQILEETRQEALEKSWVD